MPIQAVQADRLPVKDRTGEVLFYVAASIAQRWIEEGRCRPVGTKTVVRALLLDRDYDTSKVIPITAYTGQHYSHDHADRDNPEGVWTLKRLSRSTAPLFRRVVTDCLKAA